MSAVLATFLPALLPAVADGVKSLIGKLTGGPQPETVDDAVKLGQLDIQRIQALAAIDAPGANCSRWVSDLRASARYIAVYVLIGYGIIVQLPTIHADPQVIGNAQLLMSSAFSFLFGDRVYLNLKRRGK